MSFAGLTGYVLRLTALTVAATVLIVAWQVGLGLRDRLAGPQHSALPITAPLGSSEAATIAVFEAAKDSVVFISTAERVRDPWRMNVREVPRGSGSGFLWDRRGHVVTNWHVLEGASRATVRLADGTEASARLVGAAPEHDLAVLRIGRTGFPALPRGASADLRVGQAVLAIGNPFGLDWTLTTGVVSALGRDLPGERGGPGLRGLVQTDAAINPGNSGGPLLDLSGRLIGVNTAIYSLSGSSAGIGFAVPADTVSRVVPQIISTGRYAPPGIGVETDTRVNLLAQRQGVTGVLVLGVAAGSPAEAAGLSPARMTSRGLAPGDRILAVDGEPVALPDDLARAFAIRAPGDTVRLRVSDGRRERDLTLTLTNLPGAG